MEENVEETEEVDNEDTYEEVDDSDNWTTSDTLVVSGLGIGAIILIVVLFRAIRKCFKNINLKIGSVELKVETKGE